MVCLQKEFKHTFLTNHLATFRERCLIRDIVGAVNSIDVIAFWALRSLVYNIS